MSFSFSGFAGHPLVWSPWLSLLWDTPGHPKGSRWGWDSWTDPPGLSALGCDPCGKSHSPKRSQGASSRVGLSPLGSLWDSVGQLRESLGWKGP